MSQFFLGFELIEECSGLILRRVVYLVYGFEASLDDELWNGWFELYFFEQIEEHFLVDPFQ